MWSIDALLLAATLIGGVDGVRTGAACPASANGVRLSDGAVYDGPIVENAILAPGSARTTRGVEVSRWDVRSTYRAGRQIFLTCNYPRQPRVVVRVAHPVRTCVYRDGPAAQSLSCS